MKPARRRFMQRAGILAAIPLCSRFARAQDWPVRPVRFVVGFPQGGPNDILARVLAQALTERFGQPFVVDNRPGASSNLAAGEVVRAPADGYTLLLVGPANAINAAIYPALPFNFLRDIAPIAPIAREPLVMVVHPSVPAHSVAEFIAHAKASPGRVIMASTGNGSSPHVSGELFKMLTGLELPVVHFAGGGPALREMIAGRTHMMFEPISASIEPVRSGRLRALAVSTMTRSDALPGVPPLAEAVPGYEASALTGVGVPRDTPAGIVDSLNRAIGAILTQPGMKARLAEMGSTVLTASPGEFGAMMAAETDKWARVVKQSGARAE